MNTRPTFPTDIILTKPADIGEPDIDTPTETGIFAGHLFCACEVVLLPSFDGIRSRLLCFDFLLQLENFLPNAGAAAVSR